MKTHKFYIPLIIFLILLVGIGALAYFLPFKSVNTPDDGFVIKQYDTIIQINKDNTYDVQEYITVKFNELRHGIYRNIPLTHTITVTTNGKEKEITQNIQISEINCNMASELYFENENAVIKIGNESEYQPTDENVNIQINYTLNLGVDYTNDFDLVYFNVLGTDWKTSIEEFNFSIQLPDTFDASKLKMYFGEYGKTDAFTTYNIVANTISGTINYIDSFNGLTLSITLPNNYFSNASEILSPVFYILFYASIVVGIIALILFLIKNKKDILVSPVEFYPPDGLNPVEVAQILNGRATSKDITSLIVYFASKKYLKIVVDDNKNITLVKKGEIDSSAKPYEISLFQKLFEKEDVLELNKIKASSFSKEMDNLPATIFKATTTAYIHRPVKKRFNSKNFKLTTAQVALSLFLFVLIMFGYGYAQSGFTWFNIIYSGVILIGYVISLYYYSKNSTANDRNKTIIFLILSLLFAVLFVVSLTGLNNMSITKNYVQYIVGIVVVFGLFLSANTISYSKEQINYLGKIIGFKNFLLYSEKDKMKLLIKENPEYFFDVLPYAYVFGISDEFISHFESLGVGLPTNDYFSFNVIDYLIFNSILNSQFSSLSRMSNIAVSASRGGGSFGGGFGGGFSGGGFGGGGGGSW